MTVVGDGAVGLLGMLSAARMGAARIIARSRHEPGKVFDLTLPLDQVAEGYRAMAQRPAKITPSQSSIGMAGPLASALLARAVFDARAQSDWVDITDWPGCSLSVCVRTSDVCLRLIGQ